MPQVKVPHMRHIRNPAFIEYSNIDLLTAGRRVDNQFKQYLGKMVYKINILHDKKYSVFEFQRYKTLIQDLS